MPDQPQANPARRRDGALDWTITPAKWGAIGVMAALGTAGVGWSILRDMGTAHTASASVTPGEPAVVEPWAESRPAATGAAADPMAVAAGDHPPPRPEAYGPFPGMEPVSLAVVNAAGPSTTTAAPTATSARADPHEPGIAQTIDINLATAAELELLPGIGPSRARAIVEDRRTNGPFGSVDDLDRVRGIGSATVEGLRAFATAGAPS